MRTLPLACALAFVLAGCINAAQPSAVKPASVAPAAAKLVTFDALGNLTAPPDELKDGFLVKEILLGQRGGEPNIGVTPKGGLFEVAGQATMKSTDHGLTWKESFNLSKALPQSCDPLPAAVPCAVAALTRSSDPMLWVDPITGRIFTDHMTSTACSNMIISDDEGGSWQMFPMTCGIPSNDHQKVMTAKYGPKSTVPPNPLYPDVVYYCYNKNVATDCAVSLDGGHRFEYDRPVAITPIDGCGGINGHPAAGPDGTVFVPINGPFGACASPLVGVSEDNGLTWTVRKGPAIGAEEIDPEITVTKDGTAYMLWRAKDHLQYMARSKDKFVHWEGPWKVSPPDLKSTVYAGLTSGDDGRIAFAFLGTRDTDKEPSLAENATRWHLFVGESFDAEAATPHFTVQQVTPDSDPVQIGCVWLKGGSNPCRNMLDFIDMSSDKDGRYYIAFTDGCTVACANNATATNEQSHSRDGAVAVLTAGPSLVVGTSFPSTS